MDADERRLKPKQQKSFAQALREFRARTDFTGLNDEDIDEIFRDVRAKDVGRKEQTADKRG